MRDLIREAIKRRLYDATSLNIYECVGWNGSLCFDSGGWCYSVFFIDNWCKIEVRGVSAGYDYLFYYADPDLFVKLDGVMRC